MQLIANGTQVTSIPTPAAPDGTPGYINNAAPGPTVISTVIDPDANNAMLAEVANLVLAGGVALAQNNYTQAIQSLKRIFGGNITSITSTPGSALSRTRRSDPDQCRVCG